MSVGTRIAAGSRAAAVWLAAAGALAGAPALSAASGSAAAPQQVSAPVPRAAATVHPDTVRVGEPFLLGVIARADPEAVLAFPVWLELPEEVEQSAPVEVRVDAEEGTWRAYYRLVAWRPGARDLSAVRVGWRGSGVAGTGAGDAAGRGAAGGATGRAGSPERALHVPTPRVVVTSVLPGDPETAELRGPRPFLRYPAGPWPWIVAGLLVVLLAAAAAVWWRGRERRAEPEAPPRPAAPPGERAIRSLRALRARWKAGGLDGAEFFDAWEAIVRSYVESTRGWPVGVPLHALADGHRPLADALERSRLVRFARLAAEREVPSRAAAAAIAWIRSAERADGPEEERGVGGTP